MKEQQDSLKHIATTLQSIQTRVDLTYNILLQDISYLGYFILQVFNITLTL